MDEREETTPPKQGLPIGNLTSQIFSNIYLNEFDRLVVHELKPKNYLRYGDDFILFCRNKKEAGNFRDQATRFLKDKLFLPVNTKNDIIIRLK